MREFGQSNNRLREMFNLEFNLNNDISDMAHRSRGAARKEGALSQALMSENNVRQLALRLLLELDGKVRESGESGFESSGFGGPTSGLIR